MVSSPLKYSSQSIGTTPLLTLPNTTEITSHPGTLPLNSVPNFTCRCEEIYVNSPLSSSPTPPPYISYRPPHLPPLK